MSSRKNLKITFLTPYPSSFAPGQRFRFEQYLEILKQRGYSVEILSFLTQDDYKILYVNGYQIRKVNAILSGFLKRIWHLFKVNSSDFVFIFREVSPIGPPIFEWIIGVILRKKIIYDFDDAIWLTDKTKEGGFEKMFRWRSKVGNICKWSYKISCGNEYLADYAKQFNQRVVLNPTTIDVESHNLKYGNDKQSQRLVIGWTGSHSTLKYLKSLEAVLQRIELSNPNVSFVVIANLEPNLNLNRVKFVKWKKETEINDLSEISIGLMPLPDDEWTRGKCGFKALQYMALGISTIASPVGVNKKIIQHKVNGLLCSTEDDWLDAMQLLIDDAELRKVFAARSKQTVEEHYSVTSNTPNFLSLFS